MFTQNLGHILINAKHAPNSDVENYYQSLIDHAQTCSNASDARTRVTHAINLNDFENRNLSFFLYYVAKYCVDRDIKSIDDEIGSYLLPICAAVHTTIGNDRILVTHKPVLSMRGYVPYAIGRASKEINLYLSLMVIGCALRLLEIPNMLDKIKYTYEDIDLFIHAPYPFSCYDVFNLYSPVEWGEKRKTIALLRQLIAKLTVDPLSK